MTNKPERSVEEIQDELERLEEMCDGDSDQIVAMYRRRIPELLQAERQRCDEMVEAERYRVLELATKIISNPVEFMQLTVESQPPTTLTNDKE